MSTGSAHGAVTVLNATATGRGCALAVQHGVEAHWEWTDGLGLDWRGPTDNTLARACFDLLADADHAGAAADTTTRWPPSRGLKTSSSAAAALLRAGAQAMGRDLPDDEVERLAVQAARAAGVTLTGAYDDQVATVRGGCHLTDNAAMQVLASVPVEAWEVAVWVPDASIPKNRLHGVDATRLARHVEAAEQLLLDGDVPGALTHNGGAFLGLYEALGLPVRHEPVRAALEAGALGAGLSGTGPAVAALFDDRNDPRPVPGGTWHWTRVEVGP